MNRNKLRAERHDYFGSFHDVSRSGVHVSAFPQWTSAPRFSHCKSSNSNMLRAEDDPDVLHSDIIAHSEPVAIASSPPQ